MNQQTIIRFTRGVPPPESFPVQKISECANSILETQSEKVLQYGPAGGYPPLRDWLAHSHGVKKEQILIGQGSLQIQDTIARVIVRPGDLVYVEEPSYDRTITIMRRAGAIVRGWPLQWDGIDLDAVECALQAGERPILFYVIPDFQNPSGKVLCLEKRKRLSELAHQYDFWIIEDSPYRELRYSGQPLDTLFDLNPEKVLHMSSFSKLISPGLRVGYVVAPEGLAENIIKHAEDTYINPSYFNQGIVAEFIRRGWLESNIAELKKLYAPRLNTMLDALDESMNGLAEWTRPEGGFFVSIVLKKAVHTDSLIEKASDAGVWLSDGRGFFASGAGDSFIRLPFCALTEGEITEGISRLSRLIRKLI